MRQEISEQERMKLANRIKYVRKEIAHQTQSEFAFSLYVSRVYINQLENEKITVFPTAIFFQRLCDKYKVSYTWIQFGEEPILQDEFSDLSTYAKLFSDEEIAMMQYKNKHFDIPESQLYYDKMPSANYESVLSIDLKELLEPEDLSLKQYSELINTFITLYQPFLQFTKTLKEFYKSKKKNLVPICEEYFQDLEAIAKVFFLK